MMKKNSLYFDGKLKECSECHAIKSVEQFYLMSRKTKSEKFLSSDYRSLCKQCKKDKDVRQKRERRKLKR
jgi:hypothetical protein